MKTKKSVDKDSLITTLVEKLHETESDYIHMKRRFDALWYLAISEYDADPSILTWEITQRMAGLIGIGK